MAGDSDVEVRFGAQIDGLIAGVEAVKAQISSITAPINSVVSSFGEMKEALLAAFAIDKGADFVDHITEIGEQILRATEMTGLSAEEFQTLQYAMKVTGTETGNLGIVIDRLERNIALARGGSGQAVHAFETLGVTMDDLKNKSPYEIIQKIADGFHSLKDPILAAGAATEVGSRGFAQMLPALKAGSEGLKGFEAAFKETGSYLNDAQASGFAKTHESLIELQTAVQGTGVQLVRMLKPAIDLTVTALTELVEWLNKVLGGLADLVELLEGSILVGFAKVIELVEQFGVAGALAAEKVKIAWQALGRTIQDVGNGQLSEVTSEWNLANAQMEVASKKAGVAIQEYGRQYQDLVRQIASATGSLTNFWSSLGSKPGEKGGGGALGAGKDGKDELALDDIKTEEEIAKLQLETQRDIDAQALAYKTESKRQEIEAVKQAADQEYAIEEDALEQKLALYDKGSVDYEKVLNEMDVLYAKHTETIARLDAQMAQASAEEIKKTQAEYKSVFDTIDKSMDSMLKGVLQGTQSFQQAMMRLWGNLALSIIEDIAKIMLKATALEAIKLTGNGGGLFGQAIGGEVPQALGGSQSNSSNPLTAAMTAVVTALTGSTAATTLSGTITQSAAAVAEGGQSLTTLLNTATAANTTATIANTFAEQSQSAGGGGGGIFGALGGLLSGGAAAAGGGDALASAGAEAVGIAALDVGAWSIPQNGLAFLHAGEMVIPANTAQSFQAGLASVGGGSSSAGGPITINLSAIDTQTGAQFLKNNASVIAQTISGQVRNFNPNLTRMAS